MEQSYSFFSKCWQAIKNKINNEVDFFNLYADGEYFDDYKIVNTDFDSIEFQGQMVHDVKVELICVPTRWLHYKKYTKTRTIISIKAPDGTYQVKWNVHYYPETFCSKEIVKCIASRHDYPFDGTEYALEYDRKSVLRAKREYNTDQTGTIKFYNRIGVLINESEIKDGKRHGIDILFDWPTNIYKFFVEDSDITDIVEEEMGKPFRDFTPSDKFYLKMKYL